MSEPSARPILQTRKVASRVDLTKEYLSAARQPGQSGLRLCRRIVRCRFSGQKLTPEEFFHHGLHRPRVTDADCATHLGVRAVTPFNTLLNGPAAQNDSARLNNKLTTAEVLKAAGLPVAQVRGVYQAMPGGTLRDAAEIAAFLLTPGQTPCFGKPVFGSLSNGIVSIEAVVGEEQILLGDGRKVSAAALAAEIVALYSEGYVFQELLRAAPSIAHLSGPVLPTLRVCSLWLKGAPVLLYGGLRLPAANAMSDESSKGGGARLHIDMATGAVMHGQDMTKFSGSHTRHAPVTGLPLVGQSIPDWTAMLELARDVHRVFHRHCCIGTDIAVSDHGLIVNEVNSNPLQLNYQVGCGRGILNDDFRPMFRAALAERGITRPVRGAPWPFV